MQLNREKLKAFTHYICHRADTENLGAVKLNKILWYADSINYLLTGNSLTGETYKKEKYGPIPQHILPIRNELENSGCIKVDKSDYYGKPKTDFHCLKEPASGSINMAEVKLLDTLIDVICKKHTAKSISDKTHDEIWNMAREGEEIPLYTVFVSKIRKPVRDVVRKWAISVAEKK